MSELSGLSAPGIGLDIVETRRIERLARRNPRFLSRIFTAQEALYCRTKKNRWQHFAARFAAKEAVWKALGQEGMALKDISIRRDSDGRPGVLLRGRPAGHIRLSMSHSDHYAVAVAFCHGRARARKR
jgi:holo-[acyl-carrier protein] synthase